MKMNHNAKVRSQFVASIFALSFLMAGSAHAEHTRVTNPNSINLEVLGRGFLYSLNFDRVVNDDLAAGIGFGTSALQDLSGNGVGSSTSVVPVYINYYFTRDAGSLYATAGATLIVNNDTANGLQATYSHAQFTGTPVVPNVGFGYENRGDSGFLFRVAAYAILAKNLSPWGGFTVGYAF